MKLMDLYVALNNKQITEEQAAEALGIKKHSLKVRMGKWGHRLPLVLATLDKIADDLMTRDEAAEVLGITNRTVNLVMKSWNISRPIKQYVIQKAAAEVKWELRKKSAIDFIAGSDDLESCAERAGCSTRQMRRWVTALLDKHFEITFKDLNEMTSAKRKRLADEVETAENLELAKQQALKVIEDGRKTIEEEALERILATHKRAKNVRAVRNKPAGAASS